MFSVRTTTRIVAVLAFAAVLLVPATAFAARGPVPNNALVGAVQLKGLTEAQALAAIKSNTTVPALTPLVVKGDGKQWLVTTQTRSAVLVNSSAMLDQAYKSVESTATTYTIKPIYTTNSTLVASWAKSIAGKIDRKAVNAKRYVSKRKLKVKAERSGRKVDQSTTAARIKSRLLWEANTGVAAGRVPAPVYVSVKVVKPKITRKNIGKAILVVLKYRKVYLYKNTKIEKKYRCAIGTPGHPTPRGNFKIVAKRYRPTWVNPAPNGWGANMPARIGPGPNNPLGLRALNLSASGIRIHGTSNIGSIGSAASHGCIRLTNKNVIDLYKRVKVGTPVYIVK